MESIISSSSSVEAQRVIAQISAMAMVDEEFKSRLAADPRPILAQNGVDLPESMRVEVVSSLQEVPANRDPSSLYLIIPTMDDLSEEELSTVRYAAASCQSTASTFCTTPSCASSSSTASTNSCT
jgi:hypothetical protein